MRATVNPLTVDSLFTIHSNFEFATKNLPFAGRHKIPSVLGSGKLATAKIICLIAKTFEVGNDIWLNFCMWWIGTGGNRPIAGAM
jgi:hypothetical protein